MAVICVGKLVADLNQRALRTGNGKPDEVHCTVERIAAEAISYFRLPDITINRVDNYREGRALAEQLLIKAGVNRPVAGQAVNLLAAGAGPGGSPGPLRPNFLLTLAMLRYAGRKS